MMCPFPKHMSTTIDQLPTVPVPVSRMKVLITREQITKRVAEMGQEITRDFQGQTVLLIGVLKGATIFLSELARAIELDATFDFFGVSSYADRTQQSGEVRLTKDVDSSLENKNVILVEDILDTGLTMNFLTRTLLLRGPASVAIATLLDRPYRRLVADLPVRYVGFTVPDELFVGYGFDLDERYRNLPDLYIRAA